MRMEEKKRGKIRFYLGVEKHLICAVPPGGIG